MNILIIGSGGREHALAWKMAQSPKVNQIFTAPGNAGTASGPRTQNVAIDPYDFPALLQFAKQQPIDLTIIGPEGPLAQGIVDAFLAEGLPCLGPRQQAARLESSKAYAKDFMAKYHIPTAHYESFTKPQAAKDYVRTQKLPIVIKADGLAQGKGVLIAKSYAEADTTIDNMLTRHTFGTAGQTIVIEEFLSGHEISYFVLSDGVHALPFGSAQDYKRRDDHDQGPNTGGMGAVSPAQALDTALGEQILQTIIYPTLEGLAAEGCPFTGFLFAGLMITHGQAKVLEFNCRLGDPETQVILMRLDSDLLPLALAATTQRLQNASTTWDAGTAVGVVLAARGYPGPTRHGDTIEGLATTQARNTQVFHAGTRLTDQKVVTTGGRVMCVTALGDNVAHAREEAYARVQEIDFAGMFYRGDIGK